MVVVGGYAAVVRGACKKSLKLELLNESTEQDYTFYNWVFVYCCPILASLRGALKPSKFSK